MKLIKGLLAFGLLATLVACQKKEIPVAPGPVIPDSPITTKLNKLDAEYEIFEFDLPNELMVDETLFSLNYLNTREGIAYFEIERKNLAQFFPTEAIYAYDIMEQELTLLKTYSDPQLHVKDAMMKDGKFYELISIVNEENQFVTRAYCDGEVIGESTITNQMEQVLFYTVGDKIQYFLSTFEMNENERKIFKELHEIDGNVDTVINSDPVFTLEPENFGFILTFRYNDADNFIYIQSIVANEQDLAQNKSVDTLYVYDGHQLTPHVLDFKVNSAIPIEDGVLLTTLNNNVQEYYWYSKGVVTKITNSDYPDMKLHFTSFGDYLGFVNEEYTKLGIGKVIDGKMEIQLIDGVPEAFTQVANVNELNDLILVNNVSKAGGSQYSYYLISWLDE